MSICYIALLGAAGVLSRYFLGILANKLFSSNFPIGTLAINVIGAFLIGVVYVAGTEKNLISENVRLGMMVGFLGGFTTFSTYTLEGVRLLQEAHYFLAISYLLLSPVLGVVATTLGFSLAKVLTT